MARGKEVMGRLRAEGRHTKRELQAQVKNSNFWVTLVNTAALIAFYYSSSIGLTFYQSWLMKELRFPLTIVLCHFVMKFCMGWACRAAYTMHTGLERVALPWSQMLGRVAVVAVVASLDIGLSQWSFEYIDVALYTITKSTSIVFILMWAILLRLEKKHWSLVVIVVMIATGLAMFTYKSTDFVMVGFVMVLSASFLSGVRWTVSQLIMQRAQYNLSNPVDMIYHVQPMMILAILPFTVAIEGSRVATSVSMLRYTSLSTFLQTTALVAVGWRDRVRDGGGGIPAGVLHLLPHPLRRRHLQGDHLHGLSHRLPGHGRVGNQRGGAGGVHDRRVAARAQEGHVRGEGAGELGEEGGEPWERRGAPQRLGYRQRCGGVPHIQGQP